MVEASKICNVVCGCAKALVIRGRSGSGVLEDLLHRYVYFGGTFGLSEHSALVLGQ